MPHCLAEQVRTVALPRARGASVVAVDLQIGHGDEPMAPPASLIVPGDGELSPEAIGAVIEAALPTFEACYRPALAYAPELWGRLGIRFHVTEKGKTDEAFEVESRFPDERVTLCVLRAARRAVVSEAGRRGHALRRAAAAPHGQGAGGAVTSGALSPRSAD